MLDPRSEKNLIGVHPDLVRVVREARLRLTGSLGFIVTEGVRTVQRQSRLFAEGATRTMNSRHLTGHAVDLAATLDGDVRWDWPLYDRLSTVMMASATHAKVPLIWGGNWPNFRDGPHYELPWSAYPAHPPLPGMGRTPL